MSNKPLISFDYGIKFLLKNKEGYEIIEGFISALFAAQGYKPIKINALLDTESNKESSYLKRSIADLVVEDEDHNKYIVEIERSFTKSFMHKACFNTSRIIVDNISVSQDYTNIKKVFHISLLYFATKEMSKPIYHGKTIIHEIDTAHPVDIRIANQGLVMFENHNVFPEYFFISVPLFNDKINEEIDEWLYVMKHSEIRQDFKSKYMKLLEERLSVLKMSDEERDSYYGYLKEAVHSQDVLISATEKGRVEGLAEGEARGVEKGKAEGLVEGEARGVKIGEAKRNIEIAKSLLKTGVDTEIIMQSTGLSKAEIEQLK